MSVLDCHWTDVLAVAAAVKLAVAGTVTLVLAGCWVMAGKPL